MHAFLQDLDCLEDLALSGVSIPLTGQMLLSRDVLLMHLDKLRETLPEVIQQAHQVVTQREHLMAQAQHHAQAMLHDAKAKTERLISESTLMAAVEQEAHRLRAQLIAECDQLKQQALSESQALVANAQAEAKAVREGADHYAVELLRSLDKSLTDSHQVVRNGLSHLHQTQQHFQRAQAPATRAPKGTRFTTPPAGQPMMAPTSAQPSPLDILLATPTVAPLQGDMPTASPQASLETAFLGAPMHEAPAPNAYQQRA